MGLVVQDGGFIPEKGFGKEQKTDRRTEVDWQHTFF
jgi:hypothetical protein